MQTVIYMNALLAYGQHCHPYTHTQKFLKIVVKTPHIHQLFWKRQDLCSEWVAVLEAFALEAFLGSQRLFLNSMKEQKKKIESLNLIFPKLDVQIIYIPIKTNPTCCFPSLKSFLLFPPETKLDYRAKRSEKNQGTIGEEKMIDFGEAGNLNVTAFIAFCRVKIIRHSV